MPSPSLTHQSIGGWIISFNTNFTVIWMMLPRWHICFRGERTQIQSELLFFRMEASDILAGIALLVSIVIAIRTERRENKRRKEEEKISLKIKLKKHSSYSKMKFFEGKPLHIPFNYFILNDGAKDIYLKSLKLEAFYDDKWHTLEKIEYYNKISDSKIIPGPTQWNRISHKFNPDLLDRISEIHFLIHAESTLGQTFSSNIEELPPINYISR